MRIVVCDYSGHPFQLELSRHLASRGHDVLHLHFAEFQTPKGALTRRADDAATFAVEGVSLGRPFAKDRFLRRRFQEVRIGRSMAARALRFEPDIVVGCNMPLDAQSEFQRACAGAGIAFVFWLQDIYSEAIHHYLGAKFGPIGFALGRYYRRLEGRLLRASDAVIAISQKFIEPLQRWGVSPDKINVIANWAPLSEIHPVDKENDWARRHSLHDKLVALYTGTLGLKHDPVLLLDLARAGKARAIQVVVVSEGSVATRLAQDATTLGLDNLVVLPFQPMDMYSQLLGTGDIALAMVGEEAAAFSVPSKILSYLAAGKPVVAAIASSNDAARMIVEADAGIVVAPDDVTAFIDQVLILADNPGLRASLGRRGRAFADNNFAIDGIAGRFEVLFSRLLTCSDRKPPIRPKIL